MNKIVEIKLSEHEISLKNDLKYLLNHESYWNVMMFCKDGTMAHNRLTAGLIFPQLQDEISVICPDYTMQDITDQINNLLYFGEVVENSREKICASHVIDSDVRHFVQDLGFAENICHGKMFANNDLPNQENTNTDISFDMDMPNEEANMELSPLDQLCLDLAPFNQKPKGTSSPKKKRNRNKSSFDPSKFLVSNVTNEIPEQLMQSSPPLPSTSWISNQSMELEHKCDTLLNSFSIETEDTEVIQAEESSEDIVGELISSVLDNINYGSSLKLITGNILFPSRTDSVDSNLSTPSTPQPSNLIFSTLGSFRQAQPEEPLIRLTAYEAELGFKPSQFSRVESPSPTLPFDAYLPPMDDSYEYIEEKPDISRFMVPAKSSKKKGNCWVDIEKMSLSAEDWEVIHMYLEEADKYDLMSINKNRIKREKQLPTRPIVKKLGRPKGKKPFKRPKRLNRCFKCESCIKPDCRKCLYCKDMKKYGGRGTKKQSCIQRPKCLQYLKFEFKNKNRHTTPTTPHSNKSVEICNIITLEKIDNDSAIDPPRSLIGNAKKRKHEMSQEEKDLKKKKYEMSQEEKDLAERKRKVKELKARFKKQEEALKDGKNPLLSALSKDELLFGFHL